MLVLASSLNSPASACKKGGAGEEQNIVVVEIGEGVFVTAEWRPTPETP